jgi:hypothetical protein
LTFLAGDAEEVERIQEAVSMRLQALQFYEHQDVGFYQSLAEIKKFLKRAINVLRKLSLDVNQASYIFHFLDVVLVLHFEENRSVNRVEGVKLFHQTLKK